MNTDALLRKFVDLELTPDGGAWQVGGGPGGRRFNEVGGQFGVIRLRHDPGYEILLEFPDGKIESFTPFDLHPANSSVLVKPKPKLTTQRSLPLT